MLCYIFDPTNLGRFFQHFTILAVRKAAAAMRGSITLDGHRV